MIICSVNMIPGPFSRLQDAWIDTDNERISKDNIKSATRRETGVLQTGAERGTAEDTPEQ
jgi:hypothetical protein